MAHYAFRILNVFAEERLGGNALAVFEDGHGLDDATIQALALQFNLSETTFILPSDSATVRVRIFTPTFEMPFAGHPTLGSAHVVRALKESGDAVTLEMTAGIVPVTAAGDDWTLQAKAPRTRPVAATRDELASMLGLTPADVGAALRRDHPRGEHPDRRRLAGAIGAQQAEDLAPPHRQVEVVDGDDAAGIHLGEAFGPDDLHRAVGKGAGRGGDLSTHESAR